MTLICDAQNHPSLLLEKNMNATFSIVAYDETTKENKQEMYTIPFWLTERRSTKLSK
jgi:hypothetical protein